MTSIPADSEKAMSVELVREQWIAPANIEAETFLLSPLDLDGLSGRMTLSWPMFFSYDIDATRLGKALSALCAKYPILCGRLHSDDDTRFVVKVPQQLSRIPVRWTEQVDPGHPEAFGFPFSEMKADMTVAAAILKHGQITAPTADFPVDPAVPFFMETVDTEAFLRSSSADRCSRRGHWMARRGEASSFSARLTHFCDSCAVTLTVSHMMADAQRLLLLYKDLGLAYRGEAIPDRCHDRSCLWPDRLAQHYTFMGEEVANLPRKAARQIGTPTFPTYPQDFSCVEALYFPKVQSVLEWFPCSPIR